MQSQGVSATIKHYMGNNREFLRHDANSIIDGRTMREIYLPRLRLRSRKRMSAPSYSTKRRSSRSLSSDRMPIPLWWLVEAVRACVHSLG